MCRGYSLCTPMSSVVFTSPVPKNCCHIRFICTRAVSGCSGRKSQRAKPSRFAGASFGSGGRKAGAANVSFSPFGER